MTANQQKMSFQEALKQIRADYFEFKKELDLLRQKLQEAIDRKTARLTSFESETELEKVGQPDKKNHEVKEIRQELLTEASETITAFEKQTDQLIEQAKTEGETEIVKEAKLLKKKFYSRIVKLAGILLLAFAHQASELKIPAETFAEKDKAKIELQTKGITSYQSRRYIPGVSEVLFRGVRPVSYSDQDKFKTLVETLVSDEGASGIEKGVEEMMEKENNKEYTPRMAKRVDAWRLYLGLSQKYNTFDISDYKPAKSMEDKYYFKINGFLEGNTSLGKNPVEVLVKYLGDEKKLVMPSDPNFVMGDYTLSKGEDEKGHYISYYDRWDLDPTIEGKEGFFGQPFEIYDRIYYNPETFKIIEPK